MTLTWHAWQGGKFNRLLVKDLVGKTRVPSVDLPDSGFTYGKTVASDEFNAGQGAPPLHVPRLGENALRRCSDWWLGRCAAEPGSGSRESSPQDRGARCEAGEAVWAPQPVRDSCVVALVAQRAWR